MPTALRVLLVEDDLDIAASLGDFLEVAGLHVDFAYNAVQAQARVEAAAFDVLVLDVNLPGMNGYDLCKLFKEKHGLLTPVLFLTARGELADKLRGFEMGAIDYVVKPFAPQELLARIRAVTQHVSSASEGARSALQAGNYVLDLSGRTLQCAEQILPLSAIGCTILKTLISAYPGTVSTENLSRAVWGDDLPASEPLRAHIHQLRRQLEAVFSSPLIETVRGVGYRFDSSRLDRAQS